MGQDDVGTNHHGMDARKRVKIVGGGWGKECIVDKFANASIKQTTGLHYCILHDLILD